MSPLMDTVVLKLYLKLFTIDESHRGFGFVEFDLLDDAKAAIDNMHLSEIFGRTIKCSIANPSKLKDLNSSITYAPGILCMFFTLICYFNHFFIVWEDDEWLQKYGTEELVQQPGSINVNEDKATVETS
jgi:RNA recognition motif-containing protein